MSNHKPLDDWTRGEYGRIYLRGCISEYLKREWTPLSAAQLKDTPFAWYLRPGNERPTERAALYLALNGVMPPGIAILPLGETTKHIPNVFLYGDEGQTPMPTDRQFVGEICPVCGDRKPRTPDYWHKNADAADGLRTDQCKGCARKAARKRMADYRKTTQGASRYKRNKQRSPK